MNPTDNPADFGALECLTLVARPHTAVPRSGRRAGQTRGYSQEFADYRPYNLGDDVGSIDWNLYARLRKPIVRTFHAEAELNFHILLDLSASMRFGSPDKFTYAKKIASALCYVGIHNRDRVGLTTFSDRIHHVVPPQRGQQQLSRLVDTLHTIEPAGPSDFHRAFRESVAHTTRTDVLIILSDFLAAGGYQEGCHHLLSHQSDITMIQVLAAEELHPQIEGRVALRDLEHESNPSVTVDENAIDQYCLNLQCLLKSLETFCLCHRLTYVRTVTTLSFTELIIRLLHTGVWQPR